MESEDVGVGVPTDDGDRDTPAGQRPECRAGKLRQRMEVEKIERSDDEKVRQ